VFSLADIRVVPASDLPREAALDVSLADVVHLTGYALDTSMLYPGGTMTVTLSWRAPVSPVDNYVVFAHLLNEDGVLVAQRDDEPAGGRYPTSAWPAESTFVDGFPLELPADMPPGDYRLLVGMYRWPSLERLPVLGDVPGAENDTIELGRVRVAP
jgi:hypothetical protein